MSKTATEIVYEASVRALDQQQRSLDELRSRTAIVLASAGVTAAFFGQTGLADGVGGFGIFALIAFVLTALCCVAVLLPRTNGWTFRVRPKILIAEHLDWAERNDAEKLERFLAEWYETFYDRNNERLKRLFRYFWWACVLLSVDIVLWLLELAVP